MDTHSSSDVFKEEMSLLPLLVSQRNCFLPFHMFMPFHIVLFYLILYLLLFTFTLYMII